MSILGLCEWSGITVGMVATDAMLKRAPVQVLETGPIDPGRYLTALTGELAAVEESVAAGREVGGAAVVRHAVLANLHPAVIEAISATRQERERDAVGIVETQDSVAAVCAADQACKAAPIGLIVLHLARHIGGKGYFVFAGDLPDVEAAEAAARDEAGPALLDARVIARPDEAFFAELINPTRLRRLQD